MVGQCGDVNLKDNDKLPLQLKHLETTHLHDEHLPAT